MRVAAGGDRETDRTEDRQTDQSCCHPAHRAPTLTSLFHETNDRGRSCAPAMQQVRTQEEKRELQSPIFDHR